MNQSNLLISDSCEGLFYVSDATLSCFLAAVLFFWSPQLMDNDENRAEIKNDIKLKDAHVDYALAPNSYWINGFIFYADAAWLYLL